MKSKAQQATEEWERRAAELMEEQEKEREQWNQPPA